MLDKELNDMKKIYAIVLLILFYSFGCDLDETSTSNGNFSQEVVWQNEDINIKNINDSLTKVVITGLQRESKYQLGYSLKDETEAEIILSGRIHVFGDLDFDGIPEFYHEDITESADTLLGWRHLLRITPDKKITVLDGAFSSINKRKCDQYIGFEQYYKYKLAGEGEPQAVLTGNYGYLDNSNDCNSFQLATSLISYAITGNNNYLTRVDKCPIENEKLNLSILYQQNQYQLRDLKKLHNNYYSIYEYGGKLRACGDDGNNGISHLEMMAGVPVKNGNNLRRTDLMPHIKEEFTNINPAFVIWAKNNLIPHPKDSQIDGLSYEFLYQYGYKQQLRKFALLKLIIMQHGQELLMKEYANATSTMHYIEKEERLVRRDNYNTYNFLEEKLVWATQEIRNLDFDTKYLENTDYGFFLRRMLDGSEPAIWQAMQKIFKLYDNAWYERTFVNEEWIGVVPIDSTAYYAKRTVSGADSIILSKDSIPAGIAVVNGAGITLTCKNGKEVTFINNNGEGEVYAAYELMGYWPEKNQVLVDYTGWEWGNTVLVNIDNGKSDYRNTRIYPSKDGAYLAELVEEMEYNALQLYKLEGGEWIKYKELQHQSFSDGYWVDANFYFKSANQYFTFDVLDFNTEDLTSN